MSTSRAPPDVLSSVVVPVAEPGDARATARSLREYLPTDADVLVVHVVEKAGGAPDKASVEQREGVAEEAFAAFRSELAGDRVETRVLYGTDIAEAVFDAADDAGASAIVFTPRGGSRWVRLLTGNVALDLITDTDHPVLVLPDVDADGGSASGAGGDSADQEGSEGVDRGESED